MHSDNDPEHFVTLFDSAFLPIGMALHESLERHAQPFHLWILCMDELVEKHLAALALPHVSLITVKDIEDGKLLAVKPQRNRAEYCWTLTCFSYDAVFARAPEIKRLTYVDADLFFFDNPRILLREFEQSGKHVLITEHAYDPRNDMTEVSGRFCVQFITFRNSSKAKKVRNWWQERCLECCSAKRENGKFGDQKYLDVWPDLFPDEVYIVKQVEKTLAPWNEYYFEKKCKGAIAPVFYHFHKLRIISPDVVRMYAYDRIGKQGKKLYEKYFEALDQCAGKMRKNGITISYISLPVEKNWFKRIIKVPVILFREKRKKFNLR
jgi:hypothetical protein